MWLLKLRYWNLWLLAQTEFGIVRARPQLLVYSAGSEHLINPMAISHRRGDGLCETTPIRKQGRASLLSSLIWIE